MTPQVIYTLEAAEDVATSYAWYESREPGLGEDFLRCVEACVLAIQRQPRMFPVAVDDFRRALIRRFPYEIFYETTRLAHHLLRFSLLPESREMAETSQP